MSKRQNIYLVGPMGAGKTSIGRELAKELRLTFYDSDEVIEEKTGANIPWIIDIEGADGFKKREQDVIAELTKVQGIVLATGGGTVATVVNRTALAGYGIVVYLKASLEDQMERTSKSKKRPLSTADDERKEALVDMRVNLGPLYEECADLVYCTDNRSVKAVAKDIIGKLQEQGLL